MASRIVLHVGAMKSGTTFFQDALWASRDALAEHGIHVPGDPGRAASSQLTASLNALGVSQDAGRSIEGTWAELVREIRACPGTAVISSELLAPAGPGQVDRIGADLGGTALDVVVSVRDLNRTIAAMWQETIQNGRGWGWEEYLAAVDRSRPDRARGQESNVPRAGRAFWGQHATVRVVRRWSRIGSVHLVTVPPPGAPPDRLMGRFAEVVGFDPAILRLGGRPNSSLGAASVEVLRRLNVALEERGLPYPVARRLRKHVLAKRLMAARAGEEPRIGLPVRDSVRDHTRTVLVGLRDLDPVIHGDLADLEPVAVEGVDPTGVAEGTLLAAALDAHRALRRRLTRAAGTAPNDLVHVAGPVPDWSAKSSATVDAAVAALADLVAWSWDGRGPAAG